MGQVVADRLEVGAVLLRVDEVPVDLVEAEEEAPDLQRGDRVALALAGFPVELLRGARGAGRKRPRAARGREHPGEDQQREGDASHAIRPPPPGSWASTPATRAGACRGAGRACRPSPSRWSRRWWRRPGRRRPASAATPR